MTTATETITKTELVPASLQDSLHEIIEITLLTKQVHWNVQGKNFRSVHLQLDEIVADLRNYSDEIAERITTIGEPASGSAAAVAMSANGRDEARWISDAESVELIESRLTGLAAKMRKQIEAVGDEDPISEDILIEAARGIEKHVWMLKSQRS